MYKQVGTPQSDQFRKLSIDASGTLYALGYTYGNYSSGSYQGRNAEPSFATGAVFIQKFDANLNELGAVQFGTPHEDRGQLKLRNNTLYVGGITEGSLAGPSRGSFDGFLVALNATSPGAAPLATVGASQRAPLGVFPNPTRDAVTVRLEAASSAAVPVAVLNTLGQVVRTSTLPASGGPVDLRGLAAGVYVLRIAAPTGAPSPLAW